MSTIGTFPNRRNPNNTHDNTSTNNSHNTDNTNTNTHTNINRNRNRNNNNERRPIQRQPVGILRREQQREEQQQQQQQQFNRQRYRNLNTLQNNNRTTTLNDRRKTVWRYIKQFFHRVWSSCLCVRWNDPALSRWQVIVTFGIPWIKRLFIIFLIVFTLALCANVFASPTATDDSWLYWKPFKGALVFCAVVIGIVQCVAISFIIWINYQQSNLGVGNTVAPISGSETVAARRKRRKRYWDLFLKNVESIFIFLFFEWTVINVTTLIVSVSALGLPWFDSYATGFGVTFASCIIQYAIFVRQYTRRKPLLQWKLKDSYFIVMPIALFLMGAAFLFMISIINAPPQQTITNWLATTIVLSIFMLTVPPVVLHKFFIKRYQSRAAKRASQNNFTTEGGLVSNTSEVIIAGDYYITKSGALSVRSFPNCNIKTNPSSSSSSSSSSMGGGGENNGDGNGERINSNSPNDTNNESSGFEPNNISGVGYVGGVLLNKPIYNGVRSVNTSVEDIIQKRCRELQMERDQLQSLMLVGQDVSDFFCLEGCTGLKRLYLSNNNIASADGIDIIMPGLECLHLDDNNLSSFMELVPLRKLSRLSRLTIERNPICSSQGFELSMLMCMMPQLTLVNGIHVTPEARERALARYSRWLQELCVSYQTKLFTTLTQSEYGSVFIQMFQMKHRKTFTAPSRLKMRDSAAGGIVTADRGLDVSGKLSTYYFEYVRQLKTNLALSKAKYKENVSKYPNMQLIAQSIPKNSDGRSDDSGARYNTERATTIISINNHKSMGGNNSSLAENNNKIEEGLFDGSSNFLPTNTVVSSLSKAYSNWFSLPHFRVFPDVSLFSRQTGNVGNVGNVGNSTTTSGSTGDNRGSSSGGDSSGNGSGSGSGSGSVGNKTGNDVMEEGDLLSRQIIVTNMEHSSEYNNKVDDTCIQIDNSNSNGDGDNDDDDDDPSETTWPLETSC